MNINRYWAQTISAINDYLEKQGITQFRAIRQKRDDGNDLVEFRSSHIPPGMDASFSRGYGFHKQEEYTPHDLRELEEKGKVFADGAVFILDLLFFRKHGNFDRHVRLANDFNSVNVNYEIDDGDQAEVNEFLWDNLPLVRLLPQIHYQLREGLNLKAAKPSLGIASTSDQPDRVLFSRFPVKTNEEIEFFQKFYDEWWMPRAKEFSGKIILTR